MEQPDTDAVEHGPKSASRKNQSPANLSHREAWGVGEFCQTYGISPRKFYSEVARGRLRALKLGTKTIILKRDAEAWIAAMPELLGWAPPPRKTKPPIPQGTEGL